MIAVLAAVLDQPGPGHAALDGGPHVGESLGRHVGMADQVLRRAQQFLFLETADLDEVGIDVGDVALEIGLGNDGLAIDEQAFLPCDRHVHAHLIPPCKKP
jgi:hypothetical protein